jgi:hypothetical protein
MICRGHHSAQQRITQSLVQSSGRIDSFKNTLQ